MLSFIVLSGFEEHNFWCELNEWTVDDVVEWLEGLEQGRFVKHAKAFRKAKVDGKKLQTFKTDRALSSKVKIKDSQAKKKIFFSRDISGVFFLFVFLLSWGLQCRVNNN